MAGIVAVLSTLILMCLYINKFFEMHRAYRIVGTVHFVFIWLINC